MLPLGWGSLCAFFFAMNSFICANTNTHSLTNWSWALKSTGPSAKYNKFWIKRKSNCRFGLAFLHRMLRLAKGIAKPNTCCWLAKWFVWSSWVAISNLLPFIVPVLVLWVRASPVCKPTKIFFTIFSTPSIKLKLGLQILLYLGWLSTDQLIFGIANFFGKNMCLPCQKSEWSSQAK